MFNSNLLKNSKKYLQILPQLKRSIDNLDYTSASGQVTQKLLFQTYKNLPKEDFDEIGWRTYSQTNEDGILLYIFSQIGFSTRVCVDIAFANPIGSNVTNLLCNWGFTGLLVEGRSLEQSKRFFSNHPDTWIYPPKLVETWVTAENINGLLKENGVTGDIDLLSLDVDGVDYWLWKALKIVNPRVVVVEYANYIPNKKALTIPYSPNFTRSKETPDYMGASLAAFIKLAKKKGYTFVGSNLLDYNAFFVRNDQPLSWYKKVTLNQALSHPVAKEGQKDRWPKVKDLDWVNV